MAKKCQQCLCPEIISWSNSFLAVSLCSTDAKWSTAIFLDPQPQVDAKGSVHKEVDGVEIFKN